jgi:hypothetical protein
MGTKANQEKIQYWQQQVEGFKSSGLTREAYSKENGIRVYQLDYWQRKISRRKKAPATISAKQWVPVKISDEPIEKDSHVDLWIGRVRVAIRPGFDSRLLAEILRVIGAGC